jgi:hypothetical protein
MEREDIIRELKQYFEVGELVCDHILARFGEASWQFLDTDYLYCLLILRRDIIGLPMTSNTHRLGIHQRGMRCNQCDIVKDKANAYLSAHVLGKGGDFTIHGMTAEAARQRIKMLSAAFPCQVRVEGGVNWLHFDVIPQHGVKQKVYEFRA